MNKKIFTIGIISLIVDQVTKIIVGMTIANGDTIPIIPNFFYLVNVSNTGAAFSILEGKTLFLSLLSLIAIFFVLKMIKDYKINKRNMFAFGFLIGGIFGNLGDRVFLGMVRDFLKIKIFGYNFPIFNIADMCIVIGAFLLIISTFKGESNEHSSKDRRTN